MKKNNWGTETRQKMNHIDEYSFKSVSDSVNKELDFIKNPEEFYDFSHRLTKTMVELGIPADKMSKPEKRDYIAEAFEKNDVCESKLREYLVSFFEGKAKVKTELYMQFLDHLLSSLGIESERDNFLRINDATKAGYIRIVMDNANIYPLNTNIENDDAYRVDAVYKKFKENGYECKYMTARNKIGEWVGIKSVTDKEGKRIKDAEPFITLKSRKNAIKLVFALSMKLDKANDFLRKSGFSEFHLINAEDAIYTYAIVNGLSYYKATQMIEEFYLEVAKSTKSKPSEKDRETTKETQAVTQDFNDGLRLDPERFIYSLMIPNSDDFKNYSRACLNEYYKLKNRLTITAIGESLIDENDCDCREFYKLQHKKTGKGVSSDTGNNLQNQYLVSYNLCKVINTYWGQGGKYEVILRNFKKNLRFKNGILYDVDLLRDIVPGLSQKIKKCDTLEQSKLFADFLGEVVSNDFILMQLSADSNKGNNSRRGDGIGRQSTLPEAAKKNYISRRTFSVEKNYESMYENDLLRRGIMVMYLYLESFNFKWILQNEDYSLQQDTDNSIEKYQEKKFLDLHRVKDMNGFIDGLNEILDICALGRIYPNNPFDWLILRSYKEWQLLRENANFGSKREFADYESDPIAFLNLIIESSLENTEG